MDGLPKDISVAYRGARQPDINFILSSWIKSFRTWNAGMHNHHYYIGQQAVVAALAETSKIIVCCEAEPSEGKFIFGWVCGVMDVPNDTLTLHYIYVKNGYRRAGIGQSLLDQIGWQKTTRIVATHWSHIVKELRHRYKIEFNDYPLKIGNQRV